MTNNLIADALEQLFITHCDGATVRAIEGGNQGTHLWKNIVDAGFVDALVSEQNGGAGLSLNDAYALFTLCGSYAMPLPLAETMVARALLGSKLNDPKFSSGSIALATANREAKHGVDCSIVHYGRLADFVLVNLVDKCVLLKASDAQVATSSYTLDVGMRWTGESVSAPHAIIEHHDLKIYQACIYSAQLAGALMKVFNQTLKYANDREQFGRSIGKFQAIQHQLSVISEQVFAARMAAQIGCSSNTLTPNRLKVAVAKARTSEAALEVAALSHSIHGAIGFTAEFDLQLFTRRLHLWRQAAGSESYWHDVLGNEAINHRQGLSLDLIREVSSRHSL
jgi:acyl-CoA dehydrogenase